MTLANDMVDFAFGIEKSQIWKATTDLTKYLPKAGTLNTYFVEDDWYTRQGNVITDLTFRPNIFDPNRVLSVYQGINLPVVNLWQTPNTAYRFHDATYSLLGATEYGKRFPFSVKKGLIKRDHLALASSFRQQQFILEEKRANEQKILDKITNLQTHFPDNDDGDYATATNLHQIRFDHIEDCLVILADLQSKVSTNLVEIDNFVEADFVDVSYVDMLATLTHYNALYYYLFRYFNSTSSSTYFMDNLEDDYFLYIPNPSYYEYNPFGSDGSLSYEHEYPPQYLIRYLSLGAIYEEEYLDLTLFPKGTPIDETTASIRKTTTAPTVAIYKNTSVQISTYINVYSGYFNAVYTDIENLNTYSSAFYFGDAINDFFMREDAARYFTQRLLTGVIDSDGDEQKALPHIISVENQYQPLPRVSIRFSS